MVRLPAGTGDAFEPVALRHGVRVLPGSAASPDDAHFDHLRLSVALPPARLRVGVDRLAAAWVEYAGAGVPAPACRWPPAYGPRPPPSRAGVVDLRHGRRPHPVLPQGGR
jgi:hypothetical protein